MPVPVHGCWVLMVFVPEITVWIVALCRHCVLAVVCQSLGEGAVKSSSSMPQVQ